MTPKVKVSEAFRPQLNFAQLYGFEKPQIIKKLEHVLTQSRFIKECAEDFEIPKLSFSSTIKDVKARQKIINMAGNWDLPRSIFSSIENTKKSTFERKDAYYRQMIIEAGTAIEVLRKCTKQNMQIEEMRQIHKRLPSINCELKKREITYQTAYAPCLLIDCRNKLVIPLKEIPTGLEDRTISFHVEVLSPKGSRYIPTKYYNPIRTMPANDKLETVLRRMNGRIMIPFENILDSLELEQERVEKNIFEKVEDSFVNSFGSNLLQYIYSEFISNIKKEPNLRTEYERVLLPKKISRLDERLLEWCSKFDKSIEEFSHKEDGGQFIGLKKGCQYILGRRGETNLKLIQPKFNTQGTYEIKGMFPLTFAFDETSKAECFVPINFVTKKDEKNFFLTGLHSGGKTFLEENLVTAHSWGQAGLHIPAVECKLPLVNRVYFISQNKLRGKGKFESELHQIYKTLLNARKHDVVFLDEVMDSTSQHVAEGLLPEILDMAEKSRATIFLCSHRDIPEEYIESENWVVFSPEYTRDKNNKISPTNIVSRGRPNLNVNKDYARQIAREAIENVRATCQ
jgi:hypothetical protein